MTMWNALKGTALLLTIGLAKVLAVEELLATPEVRWTSQTNSATNSGIYKDNGVFLTPDATEIVAITNDGKVSAFNAESGASTWEFVPDAVGDTAIYKVKSYGGITFSSGYMVYSITDESLRPGQPENPDYTRVIALGMDGTKLYESQQLEGRQSGSPVVSSDGNWIYLTHNSERNTVGHFTILTPQDDALQVVVSRNNETLPFAPPGIFHNPVEGFFESPVDGTGNTNDIVLWSAAPVESGSTVEDGFTFGFQLALDYAGETADLDYMVLGDSRSFRTITAPLITNGGRSAYWPASRSSYFGFLGQANLKRAYFNRKPNLKVEYTLNDDWRGQPCFALPAESVGDDGNTTIFFGTASEEFVRLHYYYNDNKNIEYQNISAVTESFILAAPIVDPYKRAVYFVESVGKIHQVDHEDISEMWSSPLEIQSGVQGEMALNGDGSMLYAGSTSGDVMAIQVAGTTLPPTTAAPTPLASDAPSAVPTTSPMPTTTRMPTDPPVTNCDGDEDGDCDEDSAPFGIRAAKPLMFMFVLMVASLCF